MQLSSLTLKELESDCYIENNMPMAKALAQLIDALEQDPDVRYDFYGYGSGYHYGHSDGSKRGKNTTA